jgi:hypothetical protein
MIAIVKMSEALNSVFWVNFNPSAIQISDLCKILLQEDSL